MIPLTKYELAHRKYRTERERINAAERYGSMAAAYRLLIHDCANGMWEFPLPAIGLDRAEEDAIMFAKLAFQGWRALQVQTHEVN